MPEFGLLNLLLLLSPCFLEEALAVDERWSRRVDQSPGAARDRFDRALPGSGISGWKIGLRSDGSGLDSDEDDSGVGGFDPDRIWKLA